MKKKYIKKKEKGNNIQVMSKLSTLSHFISNNLPSKTLVVNKCLPPMVMRFFYDEKKYITEHGKQDEGNNIWIVLKLFTTNGNENFMGKIHY